MKLLLKPNLCLAQVWLLIFTSLITDTYVKRVLSQLSRLLFQGLGSGAFRVLTSVHICLICSVPSVIHIV